MRDTTHALFNPKTIKKLCSNITITSVQRKAANEWLEYLESGQLEKEKQNYFKFALIILKDLLGYPVKEEMGYEEGNVEFTFTNKEGRKVVCFEAKGTDTKDLFAPQYRDKKEHSTPVKQTWDYMGSLNLDYGVTTNYRDFVLIDKSKGTSKYHFFDFTEIKNNDDRLREFIAIFSKENVIDNKFVVKLYNASVVEEREFTKEFYKLFHETRLMLIKEFESNGVSREESIHYAQLFLNRLIFIFFAEDTDKLPKRLFVDRMLKVLEAMPVTEHSKYASETIIALFESLNKGAEIPTHIFGFNGGLFQDRIPSNIFFKDLRDPDFFKEVYQYSELKKEVKLDEFSEKIVKAYRGKLNPMIINLLAMDSFNFATELNVNILGHIFEQSLTDLEELKGHQMSKRKKEGIFYTPEYVTDYICRNTIIPYLSKNGATTVHDLIKEYYENIDDLEKKFKEIKIVDPACGSGAFLLKAVDILLEIHKEIQAFKESGGQYTFFSKGKKSGLVEQFTLTKWHEADEARKIIERNIFGVDINEESVEITKLGLFLKIATGDRKLIDLSKNIRVGNSLIDDDVIAGKNKAFSWEIQFKEIFEAGRFDVVIGNPPYVKARDQILSVAERSFIEKKFPTCYKMWDLYVPFMELGLRLLKENGVFSMIVKDTLGEVEYTSKLIELIESNYDLYQINFFPGIPIFGNEVGVENKIVFIRNSKKKIETMRIVHYPTIADGKVLESVEGQKKYAYRSAQVSISSEKTLPLGDICFVSYGLRLNSDKFDKEFKFKKEDLVSEKRTETNNRVYTEGKYLEEYAIIKELFVEWGTERCPKRLVRATFPELYDPEKLLMSRQKRIVAYSNQKHVCDNTIIVGILAKDLEKVDNANIRKYYVNLQLDRKQIEQNSRRFNIKYLLALLNSKLIRYFINYNSKGKIDTYPDDWKKIPIKDIPVPEQQFFSDKADSLLSLSKEFYSMKQRFLDRVSGEFVGIKLTRVLEQFYEQSFDYFISNIEKNTKKKFNLKEKDEWQDYFEEYKTKLLDLDSKIQSLTAELNEKVFDLYNVSKEERKAIENDLNTSVN